MKIWRMNYFGIESWEKKWLKGCVDLKLPAVVFGEFPSCFEVCTPLSALTLTQRGMNGAIFIYCGRGAFPGIICLEHCQKNVFFFFFNEILHFFIIVCILCIKKLGIRNFTGEKEQYFTIYLWLPSCQNIFRFLNTWFYFLQFIFEIRSRL